MNRLIIVVILLGCMILSCDSDDSPKQSYNAEDRVSISTELTTRVTLVESGEQLLSPFDENTSLSKKKVSSIDYGFKLILRAEVDPPEIDGVKLQATHVEVDGDLAYVSYNLKGDEYGGAVDVFDVSVVDTPKIVSQMLLKNTDVNALDFDNGILYLAEAVNMESVTPVYLTSPAALEVFYTSNGQISIENSKMIDLSSFSATSVVKGKTDIHVTTGSQGGYHKLSLGDELSEITKIDLPDLRSVEEYGTNTIVLQANPGAVKVYNNSTNQLENTYNLPDNLTTLSKSDIAVQNEHVYIPVNAAGLKVLDLKYGKIVKEYAKPRTPNGANHADYVTNSVSVIENVALIANGGAGLFCGSLKSNIPEIKAIADLDASANFVDAKRNSKGNLVIFVATGTGGLKIFEMLQYIEPPEDGNQYVGGYDELGAPFEKEHIDFTGKLDNFKTIVGGGDLPGKKPDLFAKNPNHLLTTKKTKVWVTFADESGLYTSTLSYYSFDATAPPASKTDLQQVIIFPNASKKNDYQGQGNMLPGDQVYLGEFEAGTAIGFTLHSNAWSLSEKRINLPAKYTWYTNPDYNYTGAQHLFLYDSQKNFVTLSYEDLPSNGPDKDFNDLVFIVSTDNDGFDTSKLIDMGQFK